MQVIDPSPLSDVVVSSSDMSPTRLSWSGYEEIGLLGAPLLKVCIFAVLSHAQKVCTVFALRASLFKALRCYATLLRAAHVIDRAFVYTC